MIPESIAIVFLVKVPPEARTLDGWDQFYRETLDKAREHTDGSDPLDGPELIEIGVAIRESADQLRDVFEPRLGGDHP